MLSSRKSKAGEIMPALPLEGIDKKLFNHNLP